MIIIVIQAGQKYNKLKFLKKLCNKVNEQHEDIGTDPDLKWTAGISILLIINTVGWHIHMAFVMILIDLHLASVFLISWGNNQPCLLFSTHYFSASNHILLIYV